MKQFIDFKPDSPLGKGLMAWWAKLEDNRADRAELRHCQTLDDVALTSAYQRFYQQMCWNGWPEEASSHQLDRLAAIAGLLAHVRVHNDQRLPQAMSTQDGDRNVVSELRFRSLLKITDTATLFEKLRRLLPLIGHQCDVLKLAEDVYFWASPSGSVPKAWAYTYHWPKKSPN